MKLSSLVFIIGVCLAAPASALDAYGELASQLFGRRVKGVKKVAVLPFASAESTGVTKGGLVVAQRLGAAIAATGNAKVLEGQRVEKALAADFKPEILPAGEAAAALGEALGADAAVYGLFSDLGAGRLEVRAKLVLFPGGALGPSGKVMAVRDWEGYRPPAQGQAGLRADLRPALRRLAAQGSPLKDTADWAEYAAARAETLPARERTLGLGAGDPSSEEIDAWRASPAETVRKAFLPCAPAACAALGAAGKGVYKMYYSDGFTLKVDEAGSVLDLSYPAWKKPRAEMRAGAAQFRPQGLRQRADWASLVSRLAGERDRAATPEAEAARWTFGPADTFKAEEHRCADRPAYCAGLGITAPAYHRVTYADGFTLVLAGLLPADCSYPALEEQK